MDIASLPTPSRYYDAAGPAVRPGGDQMGKDEFLKLLVAQMSNQDPLNPAQGSEYVAQLAQFSSVEQLVEMNTRLDGMGSGQAAMLRELQNGNSASLLGATGLIGKSVEATGGRALLENGKGTFNVRVDGAAAAGMLTIRDAQGNVVRRMETKALDAGAHPLEWDGQDDAGKTLPDGPYTATFEATDAAGQPVSARTFTAGTISRVGYAGGALTAWIGSMAVPLSTLTSVAE